mmetsp:Transcript_87367/g.251932  ORF Transcript_87367/g.251932 Transcript_87367/m.251932 type:complete len:210 (-) Transcript_87367:2724-3353(-)
MKAVHLLHVPFVRLAERALQAFHSLRGDGVVRGAQSGVARRCRCVAAPNLLDRRPMRFASGDAIVRMVHFGVRLSEILCVLVDGIVQQLFKMPQALRHGGEVKLARTGVGGQLRVLAPQGVQSFAVLIGRIAQHALDVVHPLLQRRMVGVQRGFVARQTPMGPLELPDGSAMLLALCEPAMHLLQLGMRHLQRLLVLGRGVADCFLQIR